MTKASKTVLILEDSRTQARIVAQLFEKNGCRTDLVHTRHEFMGRLRQSRYFLAVVDVFIGSDNMLDYLDDVRRLAPHMPVAVMTAGQRGRPLAASQALNLARRSQVDFLLPKPFDFNDIRQVCTEAERCNRLSRPLQRVLVVDDDPHARIVMRDYLEDGGWHVAESGSVEDALIRLDITRVDAVVMDIVMPGIGGMAGIRIIKSTWPDIPIIATTGYVKNTNHMQNAMLKGATLALPKPFQKAQLIDAVSRCIVPPPEAPGTVFV